MLCTYLYKTESRELELLDADELLQSAPNDEQVAEKRSFLRDKKFKGAAYRGRPRCRSGEFIWVDGTAPDGPDFEVLIERFGLHPMVVEDIQAREGRPKLHNYGEYLYLIFHAVKWKERTPKEQRASDEPYEHFEMNIVEIDCLVGPDFVVTLHAEPVAPLDDLRDRWMRRPEMMKNGTGYLLYEIMDEVLDDYFPLIDALDEHIDDFEEKLFDAGKNADIPLSSEIFALKRNLISIRRIAGPTRDVVNILMRNDADSGGRNFAYYQDLYDHAARIVDQIDNFREILSGALDAYLATESNRMNMVMKTLTACSIILLVPNLIAATYGMNFENMPELRAPGGYHGALAAMLICMLLLAAYFKRLKWL